LNSFSTIFATTPCLETVSEASRSSGDLALTWINRNVDPSRSGLRITRMSRFSNVEMVFDGKTLTLWGKNTNMYTQVEAPGTIDQLVDVLRDKYHRPVPGADMLISDPLKS
jgi:hypothetical protein